MTTARTCSRDWLPRQWAQAIDRLPPECRALALRRVPRAWRALVHYMVWVYMPTLRRLMAARAGTHA